MSGTSIEVLVEVSLWVDDLSKSGIMDAVEIVVAVDRV